MLRLNPAVRLREGPDGMWWAFRVDTGDHYELNETAFKLLEMLGREAMRGELTSELAGEYGVEVQEIEGDVDEALKHCMDEGLVNEEG